MNIKTINHLDCNIPAVLQGYGCDYANFIHIHVYKLKPASREFLILCQHLRCRGSCYIYNSERLGQTYIIPRAWFNYMSIDITEPFIIKIVTEIDYEILKSCLEKVFPAAIKWNPYEY